MGVSIAGPSSKVGAVSGTVGEEGDKDKEKVEAGGKSIAVGTNALSFRRDGMEISSPLRGGIGTHPYRELCHTMTRTRSSIDHESELRDASHCDVRMVA